MKKYSISLMAILVASMAMTGCQSIKNAFGKRDNGSLDYQQAQKLDPIKLPVTQASAEFTPLYPTPNLGENSLSLTNQSGKQYQLPPPPKVVTQ